MPDETPKAPETPEFVTPPVFPEKPPEPSAPARGRRASLRNIGIELNEEELKQTGVQRLLIEVVDRAEKEIEELRVFEKNFYAVDKENATLKEKLKVNVVMEILYAMGLTFGSAIISFAPSLTTATGDTSLRTIGFIAGFLMIGLAGFSKYWQVGK